MKYCRHVQAFAEIRRDRRLDDRTVRLGHQTAHAGQLANLRRGTPRAGIGHHEDRVERILLDLLAFTIGHGRLAKLVHHRLRDFVARTAPDIHDLVVALTLGHQPRCVLRLDFLHLTFGFADDRDLFHRHEHVVGRKGNAAARCQRITRLHELVREDDRLAKSAATEARIDDARDFLLLERLVDERERKSRRQDLGEQRAADRGVVARDLLDLLRRPVRAGLEFDFLDANLDPCVQLGLTRLVGARHFREVREHLAFTGSVDLFARRVVETQDDVLRRHDAWLAIGRQQHVVRRKHQRARFHLCLERQRHVDGHLVAVEVGVECGTDQRMQLDRLAFDQHRFERLDAQSMQRRRAVQHDRMFADHLFQDVPDDRFLRLDHLLRGLDRGREAHGFELVEDERLEEFQRHQLGQPALMQLQLRTDHDDGTSRVVDTLAEQVLPEAAALALDHVGERLQRTLVGARHGLATTAVVQQRVHRFLQHPLFVADDDVRRLQFQQALQAVVAVDHAAVQVVQVGRGETATVQRDQRTQFRRQHRQHLEDHPLGLDARLVEGLEHLEALGDLLDLGVRTRGLEFLAELVDLVVDVQRLEQRADAFGAHVGIEIIAVLLELGQVVVFRQQLRAVERRQAGVGHDECFEVKDAFDVAQRHVEHHAHARRQRLQEPDVRDRRGQFDMAHALAAHLGQRHFDAALLADHAAVLQALVLAAQALVVLDRPEDLGAEKTVALRLERAVVDRFRLLDFAVRPRTDFFRRREADADGIEFFFLRDLLEQIEQCFHAYSRVIRFGVTASTFSVVRVSRVPCPHQWPGSEFPSPAR